VKTQAPVRLVRVDFSKQLTDRRRELEQASANLKERNALFLAEVQSSEANRNEIEIKKKVLKSAEMLIDKFKKFQRGK